MDYFDEKMIKFYKNYEEFFHFKKTKKERVVLMTTKSSNSYSNFKFKVTDTILFGRESAGVPKSVHEKVTEKLKIPMIKNKRSLNELTPFQTISIDNFFAVAFTKFFTVFSLLVAMTQSFGFLCCKIFHIEIA